VKIGRIAANPFCALPPFRGSVFSGPYNNLCPVAAAYCVRWPLGWWFIKYDREFVLYGVYS